MKVLVVSDTHGINQNYVEVLEVEKNLDMIIHLGDLCGLEHNIANMSPCPVHYVAGNCDYGVTPTEKVVEIDGKIAYLTHGNKQRVGLTLQRLENDVKKHNAYIGFFGHTHTPVIEYGNGVVMVNPGSLAQPRQAGHQPSYIIMDTNNGGEPIFEIKYLSW